MSLRVNRSAGRGRAECPPSLSSEISFTGERRSGTPSAENDLNVVVRCPQRRLGLPYLYLMITARIAGERRPPFSPGSCKKIQNSRKRRGEGTPPPSMRKVLRLWRPGAPTGRIFSQLQGHIKGSWSSDLQTQTRIRRRLPASSSTWKKGGRSSADSCDAPPTPSVAHASSGCGTGGRSFQHCRRARASLWPRSRRSRACLLV